MHTSRRYCAEHKKENMVDVRKTTCEAAGCDTHPSYGIPGERPRFRSKHRENDMVDLINALCKDPDCKKLATFGERGGPVEYCGQHRKEGMVDVKNKCEYLNCDTVPVFDLPGGVGRFCDEHKSPNMVDVIVDYVICSRSGRRPTCAGRVALDKRKSSGTSSRLRPSSRAIRAFLCGFTVLTTAHTPAPAVWMQTRSARISSGSFSIAS